LTQGDRLYPWAAALVILIVFSTVACGGGYNTKATPSPLAPAQPSATALVPVTVDLSNNLFTPSFLEVEAGKTSRFQLIGDGEHHTFTIAKLGVDIPIPDTKTVTRIEFFVPSGASGDLELVCEFHKVLGMVGTIRVK
jgi:plastocyanin